MKIDSPLKSHIPGLRSLWQEAFGDGDEFLDTFFKTGFSEDRCRCVIMDDQVVAALYWFGCEYMDKSVAYVYAVATAKSHQGKGLCHQLMQDTHEHLAALGYEGAVLVPGGKTLFDFYSGMGYEICSHINVLSCKATDFSLSPANYSAVNLSAVNASLSRIDKEIYARLRRQYLPAGSVIQEKENLDFLETQADFYAGVDFLLAARIESGNDAQASTLFGIELLGNAAAASEIIHALNCKKGIFRTPGEDTPFAMYKSLGGSELPPPTYFGFAFD